MALVLNTNIASMNAQRSLASTQAQQATTFERLSTGLRINSAKDDAAGLYLAQSQTKDIRGLNMATRNASDGISMAQTAEGALDQVGQNLQRINELAIQSANGTYNDTARDGLQKEVDQLTQEINRIVETTEFNGKKLLNQDALSSVLQIGFNDNQDARISSGLEGGLKAQPGMDTVTFFGAGESFNVGKEHREQGFSDLLVVKEAFVKTIGFMPGPVKPDGTHADATDAAGDPTNNVKPTDDFKKALANQLKAFQGSEATLEDAIKKSAPGQELKFNVMGTDYTMKLDPDIDNIGTPPGPKIASLIGYYGATGTATDKDGNTVPTGGTQVVLDTSDPATGGIKINQDFRAPDAYDKGFDDDKLLTSYNAYDAAIPFEPDDSTKSYDDNDPNTVAVENGNALFNILDGDLSSLRTVDISTQGSAQLSISATRLAIDSVSEIRATFGAVINRFEAVISGNDIYGENLSAARSRIQDADFAAETANLAKQQVLQQAGIASLSQANASAQSILGLLG